MKNLKIVRYFSEKRVSLFWLMLVVVVCGSFILSSYILNPGKAKKQEKSATVESCAEELSQLRQKTSSFVRPLLLSDLLVQDRKMTNLRNDISNYLQAKQQAGIISSASVYVRKLNSGSWITAGQNDTYNPASLMKVAYLITYLKEAESRPETLGKKLFFAQPFTGGNNPNIVSFKLTPGKHYTVKELLEAMIVDSDNDATGLLGQNINKFYFKQLFTDLGLPSPPDKGEYFIGPSDYAKFFRVLYNATYLNAVYSEYAIKILLQTNYKSGICSKVDPSVPVAHKFGERVINQIAQLHECGIFYYDNEPYILSVMTKGSGLEPLSVVLSDIGEITYNYMKGSPNI